MIWRTLIVVMSTTFLTACQNDIGEQFVGTWENIRSTAEELTIHRSGENYVLIATITSCFPKVTRYDRNAPKKEPEMDCNKSEEKFPATYSKGKLVIRAGNEALDLLVDEKTGYLLTKGEQYKKITNTD